MEKNAPQGFIPLQDKEVLAETLGEEFCQSPPVKRPLNGGAWARNPEMHPSMASNQESLTATPFRDYRALAVYQACCAEGSFPLESLLFPLVESKKNSYHRCLSGSWTLHHLSIIRWN